MPSAAIPQSERVGMGAETTLPITTPAVDVRDGAPGALQAESAQLASWTAPTLRLALLIFTDPPEFVRPAGGTPPTPVKNNANAGNPDWLATVEVRNRTAVESGATPVQLGTSFPHTLVYVAPVRELPVVVVMLTLL
jgi:hypothetical protein